MKTPECQQITLVEALRDGRLGPQERASMERHLAVCADCGALARDLERIGTAVRAPREPVTPLQHQRARLGLLRRAAELSGVDAHAAPRRFPAFAMAAGLSFAAAVGWAGARVASPEEQPLRALHQHLTSQLPALLQTSVHPSGGARYERATTAGMDTVTLTSGALDVNVRPLLKEERFLVKTADAEIEVRGSSFHIEVDQGRIRGVTVIEGQAEVRYAGFSAVITSGGSWRATGDTHAANDAPTPAPSAAPIEAPSAAPSAPIVASAPAEERVASRGVTRPMRERPSARPTSPVVEPPPAPEPPAPTVAPRVAPTVSRASREFAEAMSALGKGDYLASEKQLDAFAASHPGDARADEADYLRAIALQRAGKPAAAAAAAKRYLTTRPGGAHRAEAQKIAGE
jgi:ferric-dicitrate binding protein FerR (iron transport regulator)